MSRRVSGAATRRGGASGSDSVADSSLRPTTNGPNGSHHHQSEAAYPVQLSDAALSNNEGSSTAAVPSKQPRKNGATTFTATPLRKRTRRRPRNDDTVSLLRRALSNCYRRLVHRRGRRRPKDKDGLLNRNGIHDTRRRCIARALGLIMALILLFNVGVFVHYSAFVPQQEKQPSPTLREEFEHRQMLRNMLLRGSNRTRNMEKPPPLAATLKPASTRTAYPVHEVTLPELNLTLSLDCMQQWNSTIYAPPSLDEWALQLEYKNRDFGDLHLLLFEPDGPFTRVAMHDAVREDLAYQDDDPEEADDAHDYYYAFDDDMLRNPYQGWEDDTIQYTRTCRRVNWHRNVPLNCLSLHELGLATNTLSSIKSIGKGAYRQVFTTDQPYFGDNETLVFKEYTYDREFIYSDYEFMRMDALVSERLTSSPWTADIYGFCALSMLTEFFAQGDIGDTAQPVTGGRSEIELNDADDVDPQNDLTATEKLTMSLEMAEGIAALHSYPGGVIVHDDIQLQQFLFKDDGHLVLNDFNRAEVMFWDEENQEYCRYRNNPGHGDWRAPQEFRDDPLDEKIDVWSYGNNVYALLTGLSPFYDLLENSEVRHEIRHGRTAFIDPRYRERSYAEKELVEIIEKCWIYEPDDRIDIFEIVKRLRHAVEVNKNLGANNHQEDRLPPATGAVLPANSSQTGNDFETNQE